jgi:hypothetical protein
MSKNCVDCNKILSSDRYKRCRSCTTRLQHKTGILNSKGKNNPNYQNGNKISGANNKNWKGGVYKEITGYVMIMSKGHPHTVANGYVKRSRLVMEKHLKRFLDPSEAVHHINGIKDDDRIENLLVMTHKEHSEFHYHNTMTINKKTGKLNKKYENS